MTYKQDTSKPLYSIVFCPLIGTDQSGQTIYGAPQQIGTVWPRANPFHAPVLKLEFETVTALTEAGATFLLPFPDSDSETRPAPELP